VSTLSGLRLAICAFLVVGLTWTVYSSRRPETVVLYRGAMAGAAVLAVLALFHSPGVAGGLLAAIALVGAARFPHGAHGRE
jgi:hypothetical protein